MNPAFSLLLVTSALAQSPAPEARVVISSPRAGKPDLFLVDPATGSSKNLTTTADRIELWPAWSPDGKQIATATWMDDGSRQTEITVMAADGSGRKRIASPDDGGTLVCPTWSADGKRIAYARLFGTPPRSEIRIVNADGSDDKMIAENASLPAWSPDGERIACSRMDPEKKTCRLALMKPDGTHVADLTDAAPDVVLLAPAWSPDGKWIAYAAAASNSVEMFRISPDGKLKKQLTHVGAGTMHPVWLDEDTILCTHLQPQGGGAYLSIRADGTRLQVHPLAKLEAASAVIRPAVVPPRSFAQLTSRSGVRPVAHVEAAAGTSPRLTPIMMFRAGPRTIVDVPWAADGQRFAGISPDGHVTIADVSPEAIRTSYDAPGHKGGSTAVAWAHDAKRLYSTGMDKTVRLWKPPTTEPVAVAEMSDAGGVIAVHPDGKFVAVAGPDCKIALRDPETLKDVKSFPFDEKKKVGILGLAWSKDGRTLFAAGGSGSLAVIGGAVAAFDPDTGKEKWRTKSTLGNVAMIALSPDGTKLLGASGDTYVRVWNAADGKELHCLKGHTDRVSGITWAPDGKSFASCSLDHTMRVWDAASGESLATLSGHLSPVIRIHYRPDGKSLLSTGLDRVLLWKVE